MLNQKIVRVEKLYSPIAVDNENYHRVSQVCMIQAALPQALIDDFQAPE